MEGVLLLQGQLEIRDPVWRADVFGERVAFGHVECGSRGDPLERASWGGLVPEVYYAATALIALGWA